MLTNCLVFAFINNMERLPGHFENEVFVFSHLRPVDHPKDVFHCFKLAVEDSRCPKYSTLRLSFISLMQGFH
jgi:hypothetical protein